MALEPKSATRLFKKAAQAGIPLDGTFELTPLCNMSCEMCYVRKTVSEVKEAGGLISADKWYELAVAARNEGMLMLLLTGGEPFTYPGFEDLYTRIKNLGMLLTINTNGTLLTEEHFKFLASNSPYRVQMTLYGGSNETYDRLCHHSKGFDRVIEAIEGFKRYNIPLKLSASLTPANIGDLEEIYRIAREYNVYVQATPYMFPPLRRDASMVGTNFRFSPEEAGYHMARIERLRFGEEGLPDRLERLLDDQKRRADKFTEDDCQRDPFEPMGCRAGRSCFWVNWKGEMTACGMQNDPKGYPFRDGLKVAWDQIREHTKAVRMPVKCTTCDKRSSCSVCGASVYCENGSINNIPPSYVCQMTESYLDFLHKFTERK